MRHLPLVALLVAAPAAADDAQNLPELFTGMTALWVSALDCPALPGVDDGGTWSALGVGVRCSAASIAGRLTDLGPVAAEG